MRNTNRRRPWDSGLIRTGESWSRSLDVPGAYTYFCTSHEAGGMIGSILVVKN